MAKNHYSATIEDSNWKASVRLTLLLWEEGEVSFVYAPQLDLTGYGLNEAEAKESFNYQLEEFLKYTIENNTLLKELKRLGWETDLSLKKINAPNEEMLLVDSEIYKDLYKELLVGAKNIHKETTEFSLPL